MAADVALRVADSSARVLQHAHAFVKQQRQGQALALGPGEHTAQASGLVSGEAFLVELG